jgi:hypothetical protein
MQRFEPVKTASRVAGEGASFDVAQDCPEHRRGTKCPGTTTWVGRSLVVGVLAAICSAVPASAQTPAAPKGPRPGEVAVAPIKCWWKADTTAVRVGERFGVTLTCGVIEAGDIVVVPALNQLEGGALALTPFDVISSVRREDIVSPPWRYFQFEYVVRLLSDGFFGQDVNIPALTVTYNLKAQGGETEGRDQTYILPALPMRILSLVPRGATDIRDASTDTFALLESRRFRSTADLVASGILFAFAALLAVVALVTGTARFRTKKVGAARPIAMPAMLSGSLRALDAVKTEAQGGWTPELARRALSALRVGGAVALRRPVAQEYVARDARERDGQVAVRTGLLRPKRAMVSAAVTSSVVAAHLANGHAPSPSARAALEPLGESLRVFNATAYGRAGDADSIALNAALEQGTDAIKRLRSRSRWPLSLIHA